MFQLVFSVFSLKGKQSSYKGKGFRRVILGIFESPLLHCIICGIGAEERVVCSENAAKEGHWSRKT